MQQKALVTVFGLVLVVSVGYALTRMATGSGPAAFNAEPAAVATESTAGDACCPGGSMDQGDCDMTGKSAEACPYSGVMDQEKVIEQPVPADKPTADETATEVKPVTGS